jgi:L-threonylcarbamoyladenylate synthase
MRGSRSNAVKRPDERSGPGPNESFHLRLAATVLRAGGVVAHATEGVWGLACDPFDFAAVARLLDLKGRSVKKGLILIGSGPEEFESELSLLNEVDEARVRKSWPGANTWLVPNSRFPEWISGGRAKVAIRVPGHEQARRLSSAFGGPLVSTSANPAGRPAARSELNVRQYFSGRVDFVLHGTIGGNASPSQIRDAASGVRFR